MFDLKEWKGCESQKRRKNWIKVKYKDVGPTPIFKNFISNTPKMKVTEHYLRGCIGLEF